MQMTRRPLVLVLLCLLALPPVEALADGRAQIGPPPATVYGSIADSEGDIPAGVKVEAYIGDRLCGETRTEKTGEGAAVVTVYAVHVLAAGDGQGARPGCGTPGAPIRIKVGDRFAPKTVTWESGYPIRFDITFNDATPAPIPTFTPTPSRTATVGTPAPGGTPSSSGGTQGRSPGAGSPAATESPAVQGTRPGGLASSTPAFLAGDRDGNGFPVWAAILAALGAIALVGGGVGFVLARNGREPSDGDDGGRGGAP